MSSPATLDLAPGLELAFADEPAEGDLEVVGCDGELPPELVGSYLLNGPGRFTAGEVRYRNWLDGDGMVLAVDLGGGPPRVRQRFVCTRKLDEERRAGRALYRAFGTRFAGDRLPPGATVASPVNLSAYPFAGAVLAFGEQGQPWALAPLDLDTRGPASFGGAVTAATPFSGHPKLDPASGELVNFGVSFLPAAPTLHFFSFTPQGELARRARAPLPWPASIHDFALAPRHAVFHVAPHLLDLAALRDGATVLEALSWRPELGSRLLVLTRDTGAVAAELPVGEGYCLHLLNAWEQGEGVLGVDLLELDRPVYADYHDLPDLFVEAPGARTVRYAIDLPTGAVSRRQGSELGMTDFPTFDRRLTTRRVDCGWALSLAKSGLGGRKFFDRLVGLRWDTGTVEASWEPPMGCYLAGEPAFASDRPSGEGASRDAGGAPAGTSGWLLVPLWQPAEARSGLAVLAAGDLAAGPRATVWWRPRSPLGFHSFWAPVPRRV